MVRRIPELSPKAGEGQPTLFDTHRFHAFFTTADPAVLDTVAADKTHRAHAVIEQIHADLKNAALASLPSGKFNANAVLVVGLFDDYSVGFGGEGSNMKMPRRRLRRGIHRQADVAVAIDDGGFTRYSR